MEFEWNENKRTAVIKGRQVDFCYAALIFDGPVLTRIDDRKDYGETRFIALGMVDDECFVVVYTDRPGVRRLISAWKGGRSERSEYQKGITSGTAPAQGEG